MSKQVKEKFNKDKQNYFTLNFNVTTKGNLHFNLTCVQNPVCQDNAHTNKNKQTKTSNLYQLTKVK